MGVSKVVMIDDNNDLTDIISEVLGILGYDAVSAANGPSGIDKARQCHADLILCDIGLPGMSGYEVAKSIRDDDELKSVYLIAMSGYSQPDDIRRSMEAGFDLHLCKPVTFETLKMTLDEVSNSRN